MALTLWSRMPLRAQLYLLLLLFLLAHLPAVHAEGTSLTPADNTTTRSSVTGDNPVSNNPSEVSSGSGDNLVAENPIERSNRGGVTAAEDLEEDRGLRADEAALSDLDRRSHVLEAQLKRFHHQRDITRRKLDMIRRVTRARMELKEVQAKVSVARSELELQRTAKGEAEGRKAKNYRVKEEIAASRRTTEKEIHNYEHDGTKIKQQLALLRAQQQEREREHKKVEEETLRLKATLRKLGIQFKEQGFHNWITYNSEALPVLVKNTLIKTSNVLGPLAGGLESAAEAEERLQRQLSERAARLVPSIKGSPFYEGILFYVIILFPTVLAAWLVLKVQARLATLTISHYVIVLNLYFACMSALCLIMSLISGADILIVFQHRSRSTSEAFMLFHAFLFTLHLVLHGLVAYVSQSSKDLATFLSVFCVGLHFFVHAYKRIILDLDPNIGPPAYLLYSIIFAYTLYDRGLSIIEAAVNDTNAPANAFETYAPQQYAVVSTLPERNSARSKQVVYFAGLPVFSNAHAAALDDPKSI